MPSKQNGTERNGPSHRLTWSSMKTSNFHAEKHKSSSIFSSFEKLSIESLNLWWENTNAQLWSCARETFNWEMFVRFAWRQTKGEEIHKQFHENVIKFNWDWNIAGGHVSTSSSSSSRCVVRTHSIISTKWPRRYRAASQWQKQPAHLRPQPPPTTTTTASTNNRLRKTNRDSLTDWLIRICFCFVVFFFNVRFFLRFEEEEEDVKSIRHVSMLKNQRKTERNKTVHQIKSLEIASIFDKRSLA